MAVTGSLKLGKLDAVRPHLLGNLDDYLSGRPPQPPERVAAPVISPWGMLGNDQYGDCTFAGAEHLVMALNLDLNEHDPGESEYQVVAAYLNYTHGADSGANECDLLGLWQREGLMGTKIGGFAPVTAGSLIAFQRAIYLYGAAYLGIQCPESAQQQFAVGHPWTFQPSSPIVGGHCILAVGYEPAGALCVSWGKLVVVTWPFLAALMDEAWAVIPQSALEAKHGPGPGLDVAALTHDLSRLAD